MTMLRDTYDWICKRAVAGDNEAYAAFERECVYDIKAAKVGDIVVCDGNYALVLAVRDRSGTLTSTEVVTNYGSRWHGEDHNVWPTDSEGCLVNPTSVRLQSPNMY